MTPKQREALDALEQYRTQAAAAKALGISRSSLRSRLAAAGHSEETEHIQALGSIEEPPHLDLPAPSILKFPANAVRVCVMGDWHDSPHIPNKDRFYWMGRHIAETKADYAVQLGDITTFSGLNRHVGNETLGGKRKPSFLTDLRSLHEALKQFNRGIGEHRAQKHITIGNHEVWARQFENQHPELEGIIVEEFLGVMEEAGFSHSPYGAFHYIENVGFVHAPLNKLGKPYGGKTACRQIANEAVHDVVFGNSHNLERITVPKLGGHSITVINAGCCLPAGYVEPFARHSLTGWWWGVVDLVIAHGRILSVSETSMAELEFRYAERLKSA